MSDQAPGTYAPETAMVNAERLTENPWSIIDTAPKREGETVILGWNIPGYEAVMGFWSGDYHGVHAWCDEHYENAFNPQPTHWMPRPKAPRPA